MKKGDLIKLIHEKYKIQVEILNQYTVKGLEKTLINGVLPEDMKRKNWKKKGKKKIPKTLKNKVWDTYIGKQKGVGNCYCCNESIDSKHFEAGHIIAEAKNGSTTIDNLRPICSVCNKSIGTMNMDKFKQKYMSQNTIRNETMSIPNKNLHVSGDIIRRKNRFSDLVQAQLKKQKPTYDEKLALLKKASNNNFSVTNIIGNTSKNA